MILLLRNNYISYGAWFVFGSVDSHKTFSNKLNSNWTMIFLFTIFLTYTYTDTFYHYAQNLLKISPFFAYWYMCTIASSSFSSWKKKPSENFTLELTIKLINFVIKAKWYHYAQKTGNFRVSQHLNIMTYLQSISIGIYMYIKIDRGIRRRETVAYKLSNVRMYGTSASVCDLNFDLFFLCFIFI